MKSNLLYFFFFKIFFFNNKNFSINNTKINDSNLVSLNFWNIFLVKNYCVNFLNTFNYFFFFYYYLFFYLNFFLFLIKRKVCYLNTFFLKSLNVFFKLNCFFFFKKKSNSGRNNSGKITVRHKKLYDLNFLVKFYVFKKIRLKLGLIISSLHSFKNLKWISVLKFSDNSYFLIKSTSFCVVSNYFFFFFGFTFLNFKTIAYCSYLFFLKKHSIFSNLQIKLKTIKYYSSAAGTFSQIKFFFFEKNYTLVVLPSGFLKFFNCYTLVFLGRSAGTQKKHCFLAKAGILKKIGKKPSVRGVAMNPVDHPHGGRTKTNSPEVSPWGWVTKNNK